MRPQYYGTVDTAAQACLDDAQPMPEGDMYDNCNDGVDNDCDGAADMDDGDCTMMEADVWLKKVIAHRRIQLKTDQAAPSLCPGQGRHEGTGGDRDPDGRF